MHKIAVQPKLQPKSSINKQGIVSAPACACAPACKRIAVCIYAHHKLTLKQEMYLSSKYVKDTYYITHTTAYVFKFVFRI